MSYFVNSELLEQEIESKFNEKMNKLKFYNFREVWIIFLEKKKRAARGFENDESFRKTKGKNTVL